MKLYVMRHGQTDWNVLKKVQGFTDIELNSNGINQAKESKKIFNKYDIDLIISSPLKRARKTAEIISQDKKTPIILNENLKERGFGELEGRNPTTDPIFENFKFWNYNKNVIEHNIEPVVDCCNRVWNFLDTIKEKYSDKKIMLVTHGGIVMAINTYFYGIPEDGELFRNSITNCEIREYEFK